MKNHIFSKSVKGSSHESNGKPMQDWSEHVHLDEYDADLILISDGHGSDKHFRSDRGARFAVESSIESLTEFLAGFSPELADNELRQRGVQGIKDPESEDYTPKDEHEREFRQLFENIRFRWCEKVSYDWTHNPPTLEELHKANTQGKALSLSYYEKGKEVKAYGCTLLAAVKTPDYWLAFQLGDGKCIAFREDGTWFEPIPWDSRCFLTTTTSLCNEGSESFRYCYGNESCPALFIGSDGMDDSYMPLKKLAEFYAVAVRAVAESGVSLATEQLSRIMPSISKNGSHDDISIAFWIDGESVESLDKNIQTRRLELLEEDRKQEEKNKKDAEMRRVELSERKKQLSEESQHYISSREGYDHKLSELEHRRKKAYEDLEIARSMYEDCQRTCHQYDAEYEKLVKQSEENEKAYEIHLKEVTLAEELFRTIESKIIMFDSRITWIVDEIGKYKSMFLKF